MRTLGEKLLEARKSKKLILRKVSAGTDIDQSLISKFEKNERRPTHVQLKSLAKFYDIDEKDLIIDWYSEKIADDLKYAESPSEILKIAEEKLNYIETNKHGKK
ncbi:helix-turn-helix domain-containing protein [Marinicella gelatinilytica]|uniref:helix-turn-helix domain-containing protein n=1 Tax=Marinicella gelatinilytica TaxID=2996017 RepID=UPI002260A43B|nr:helix-turn-helix transcriptional regulator [Marinicella gelatinilytica]MCX7544159.1 helix-turn-helix transcriptional regulator [Marinicella gelatinilytica]